VSLTFTWDRRKASANLTKHGVSFEEAVTAFEDPLSLTIPDPEHSETESRYVLLGPSHQNRLVAVVHTESGDIIRVVSARMATRRERRDYEEG
jgi:uncharacterized DUF497 family protein